MAADYLGAICEVWNGHPQLAAWTPLYVEEVSGDVRLPRAVLNDDGADTEYDSERKEIVTVRAHIEIFADRDPDQAAGTPSQPLAGVERIARRCRDAFKVSGLAVEGYTNMELRVGKTRYSEEGIWSSGVGRVYKATLDVFAMLSRP